MPPIACERMDLHALEPGLSVAGAVCLRRKSAGSTKDGKPYLTLEVGNRTGCVSARIWSENVSTFDDIGVGTPLYLAGNIKAGWKNGPPELVIGRLEQLARPHQVELEVNPICPVPLPELRGRFDHILAQMSQAGESLVRTVLADVGEDDWWTAPAAKVMHHACIHGLAWHSIEVAEIALALARSTPAAPLISWDALLVGALLHDVAKVREYRWRGVPIALAREALLTYHTASGGVLTMLAVERARDRLAAAGVTRADVEHLCHVQLSHHGVAEYGSPVEPRTLEATLVHHADNVSAKVRGLLDDLTMASADDEGWITPSAWGRKAVLSLTAAPSISLLEGEAPVRRDDDPSGKIGLRSVPQHLAALVRSDVPGVTRTEARPHGVGAPVFLRVVRDAHLSSSWE